MMMRSGDRNSGRKLEVATQAGMVVLVLMVIRGRGGGTRAGARGIRGRRRRGGEGECMQRYLGTVRMG